MLDPNHPTDNLHDEEAPQRPAIQSNDQIQQSNQLSRQLSMPTRLTAPEFSSEYSSSGSTATATTTTSSNSSNDRAQNLHQVNVNKSPSRRLSDDMSFNRNHKYRLSNCETSNSALKHHHRHLHYHYRRPDNDSHHQHHHHHLHSHHNHLLDNSASSPGSSSASDSAFSQSQTTLESESSCEQSHSNCFRSGSDSVSSSSNHSTVDNDLKDAHNGSGSGNGEPEGAGNHLTNLDQTDQFKIIWRDLSYRVPEKRFARLEAYLKRQKEAFWPNSDQDHQEAITEVDDLQEHKGGHLKLGNDEPPPLRPPTLGKPRKIIFSNLNGCVKSGQLTAILGPSGAGKTTFLKCLTNSIVKGVSGSIDIKGGGSKTDHNLKLCIIPQKDYLFDNLTVMENLLFASRIKNTQPGFDHSQNVQRVASLLGLQGCLKLKTSKLSGGQYKRVSITQELLSKPDILILDEPTSGLDSLTCFRTVSVLRDLVCLSQSGVMPPLAIVMTIHQPQIKIFNLFHHVYILSSRGQCVYEGRPECLINTVADCCKLLPPPDDLNPASFIIDLASEVYGNEPIDKLTKLQVENFTLLHSDQLDSDELKEVKSSIAAGKNKVPVAKLAQIEPFTAADMKEKDMAKKKRKPSDVFVFENQVDRYYKEDSPNVEELKISDRLRKRNSHEGSFWLHTGLLIKRLWISMWRDPLLTTTRIAFHLIIPFVFYVIYSQKSGAANACPHVEREFDLQTMTSSENIHRLEEQHNELILTFENVSLFFILLYSFSMCVLAVTALSFPLNMQILLKETSNGWYSMPRFVMAKTLADLPIELTMPTISVAIAYVMTGQPSSYLCWRMLAVTAVMTLCSLISQTQGLLFGAYFMNNVQAAVFISQASSLPWILLSGFTTRVSELPTVLQWLSFGSIYRLGIESIIAVRYGFGTCPCDQEVVNNRPAKMVGIPDQLRSVMRYYLESYTDSQSTTNSTEDVFEKIASTLSRANTYGVDIVDCHDVRPFILSAREVDESTLPTFLLILVFIFVCLKVLLFCVVRLRAG